MSILLRTITDRAEASFPHEVTKDNFDAWERHWFATAKAFAEEAENEGLLNTALSISQIFDELRRVCK